MARGATTCAPDAAIRRRTMAMPARKSADTTTAGQHPGPAPVHGSPPPQQGNVLNGATRHQSRAPSPGDRLAIVFEMGSPHQFHRSWRTRENQWKQPGHRQHANRIPGQDGSMPPHATATQNTADRTAAPVRTRATRHIRRYCRENTKHCTEQAAAAAGSDGAAPGRASGSITGVGTPACRWSRQSRSCSSRPRRSSCHAPYWRSNRDRTRDPG